MRQHLTQQDILDAIVTEVHAIPDVTVTGVTTGVCLTAVFSQHLGLASLVSHIAPGIPRPEDQTSETRSVHELAALLRDPTTTNTDKASLAMAAVNSLLPPPVTETPMAGQDILLARGKGKKVAVIGHFPFVTALRDSCETLWVLEKRPKPGDVDASKTPEILPRADLVAVTGTTLLNGTLAGILELCRDDAFVVLIGPTTPYATSLFDCGIDMLAGCAIPEPEQALTGIRAGYCFKGLSGVRQTAWMRSEAMA